MEEQKWLRLTLEIAFDETRDMSNGEFAELIANVNGRLVTTTRKALRPLAGEGHIKLGSVALEVSHLTELEAVQAFGGRCVRCGYDKCLGALEFHHLDPFKKDPQFKTMNAWPYKRKKKELKKCELLCANCHREKHYKTL